MADKPNVTPGQRITIGENGPFTVSAVVCTVYEAPPPDCEVVYLDEGNKAISENVKWCGTHWEFASQGPSGGYADNYPRLSKYVSILREKRRN